MIRALVLAAALAGPVAAQDSSSVLIVPPEQDGTIILPEFGGESLLEPDLDLNFIPDEYATPAEPEIVTLIGEGAFLRGLDKLSGAVADIDLIPGQTTDFGRLQVTLGECRYPEDNPSGDAFAYLVIRSADEDMPVFQGWMIASSPALNAMDHARYDVWVMRCKIS